MCWADKDFNTTSSEGVSPSPFSPWIYSRLPLEASIQTGETFQILDSLTALTAWAVFSKGEGIKLGCAVTQTFSDDKPLAVLQRTLAAYLSKHSHQKRQSCPSPLLFVSTLPPCASTSFSVNILQYWADWKINLSTGFGKAIFQLPESHLSPDYTNICAGPKTRQVWGHRNYSLPSCSNLHRLFKSQIIHQLSFVSNAVSPGEGCRPCSKACATHWHSHAILYLWSLQKKTTVSKWSANSKTVRVMGLWTAQMTGSPHIKMSFSKMHVFSQSSPIAFCAGWCFCSWNFTW